MVSYHSSNESIAGSIGLAFVSPERFFVSRVTAAAMCVAKLRYTSCRLVGGKVRTLPVAPCSCQASKLGMTSSGGFGASSRPERKLEPRAKATKAQEVIHIDSDDEFTIPPSATRRKSSVPDISADDLFPALSDPFDVAQEPASSKEARALISTAKALVTGGQQLPESAFLWLCSVLLSEKIASPVRTSAFVVLAKVAESVVHVPSLCASGNLSQLYLDRVVRPLIKGTRVMNEDLNSFLHVLDVMFAEDKTGKTDSRKILVDFVGNEARRSSLCSLTLRAVSAIKDHKGSRALTAEVRKTSMDRLRRFVQFFRLDNAENDEDAQDELGDDESDSPDKDGREAKSGKSGKEAKEAGSDDEPKTPKKKKKKAKGPCKCLTDGSRPACSEPASDAKRLAFVMIFESGNQRLMTKAEMDAEPVLFAVCWTILRCLSELYLVGLCRKNWLTCLA
jgi:hypothetical protein